MNRSIGTGMLDASRRATAPAPKTPNLRMAGRTASFHFAARCAKNSFKPVPFQPLGTSIQKDHCTCCDPHGRSLHTLGRRPSLSPDHLARIERNERIVERTRTEPGAFRGHAPARGMPLSVVPTSENDP